MKIDRVMQITCLFSDNEYRKVAPPNHISSQLTKALDELEKWAESEYGKITFLVELKSRNNWHIDYEDSGKSYTVTPRNKKLVNAMFVVILIFWVVIVAGIAFLGYKGYQALDKYVHESPTEVVE